MKLIIGARGTSQEGWTPTERGNLDIRSRDQWLAQFPPNSVDAVVSEHVLEHLSRSDAKMTARNIFEVLRSGGHWRIAVPDANNPDPLYQDTVRPGGSERAKIQFWNQMLHGADEPDHLEHYNLSTLTQLLNSVGFVVKPLEWYDETGTLYVASWSIADGLIRRNARSLYLLWEWIMCGVWNTSLIVDAVKA